MGGPYWHEQDSTNIPSKIAGDLLSTMGSFSIQIIHCTGCWLRALPTAGVKTNLITRQQLFLHLGQGTVPGTGLHFTCSRKWSGSPKQTIIAPQTYGFCFVPCSMPNCNLQRNNYATDVNVLMTCDMHIGFHINGDIQKYKHIQTLGRRILASHRYTYHQIQIDITIPMIYHQIQIVPMIYHQLQIQLTLLTIFAKNIHIVNSCLPTAATVPPGGGEHLL